jgi:hypothetical protein
MPDDEGDHDCVWKRQPNSSESQKTGIAGVEDAARDIDVRHCVSVEKDFPMGKIPPEKPD